MANKPSWKQKITTGLAIGASTLGSPNPAMAPVSAPPDRNRGTVSYIMDDAPPPDKKTPAPTVTDILSQAAFTDQYGEKFDPETVLKGKPYMLVFGYGGCQICQTISHSLGAVQDALTKDGKDIPIVVVSVKPEQDRYEEPKKNEDPKNPMKDYVGRYHIVGVRMDTKEKLPEKEEDRYKAGEAAYDKFRDKPQRGRLLNILSVSAENIPPELEAKVKEFHVLQKENGVTPASGIAAKDIPPALELSLGQPIDPTDYEAHSPHIILCDGTGKKIGTYFAAIDHGDQKKRGALVKNILKDVNGMGLGK